MPIKSTKDKSKKSEETPLQKIRRERLEKEASEEKKAEDKRIADEKELARKKELITEYLDQLEKRLQEKGHVGFWTFPDRTGFKKISASTSKIEKMLNKDPNKYDGRQIAEYVIMFHQNKKSDTMHQSSGLLLSVTIRVYDIKEKGEKLILENSKQCDIAWTIDDFKISKFSFKLIEMFMKPLAERKTSCVSILGKPLKFVLERYKKDAKVDFSDALQPLKNL
jgi:hypothetical protein